MTNFFLARLLENAVSGSLLLIVLLCVHNESAEGVLVQTPANTTVIANHSTVLYCSKSNNKSTEPTWYHYPSDRNGKVRQDVFDDKEIRDKYIGRFDIDKNVSSGTFNLLVQRPEPTDAGRYECVEDSVEKDTGPSAELTVLDSNVTCGSNNKTAGSIQNEKRVERNQLQLSCSVTYSGNFPLQMQWIKVGSELQTNETNCGDVGNRVVCNVTMEVNNDMDGSVYICRIITAEQYNCSFEDNKTVCAWNRNFLALLVLVLPVGGIAFLVWKKRRLIYSKKKMENGAMETVPLDDASESVPLKESVPTDEVDSDEVDSDAVDSDEIVQACKASGYIGKGLSGRVYGPGRHKDKNWSCEEIMCLTEEQTPTNTGEMSNIKKICIQGQQWRKLDQKNLIQFYDVVLRLQEIYILMEYAEGGSVRNVLKIIDNVEMPLVKNWTTQIADGMDYLHSKDIVHENLNSVQILVMELCSKADNFLNKTLKISQFCLTEDSQMTTHAEEKNAFTAPELFVSTPEVLDLCCKKQSDVWSFGIVIWEILTKKIPYNEGSHKRIMDDIGRGAPELEILDAWPAELKEMLIECRSVTSSERPSFSEILLRLQNWKTITEED